MPLGMGFYHQFTGKNFSKSSYFDAEGAFEPATDADISRNPSLFYPRPKRVVSSVGASCPIFSSLLYIDL